MLAFAAAAEADTGGSRERGVGAGAGGHEPHVTSSELKAQLSSEAERSYASIRAEMQRDRRVPGHQGSRSFRRWPTRSRGGTSR